jgi:hypothetical protein
MSRMPLIGGRKTSVSDLPKYTWNADLISFDGPLLSLFKQSDGLDALFVWLDCDKIKNRWCVVPLKRVELWNYLSGKISLRSLVLALPSIHIFTTGAKAGRRTFFEINVLPDYYVPDHDSFLTAEISTSAAKKLIDEAAQEETLVLVGEELYLEDLEGIPKLYQQLYSFHYGMEHLSRPAVRNTVKQLMSDWHGGIGAVNLFSGLRSVTPSIHRARVVELRYNSPGVIKMSLLPLLSARIKSAINRILTSEDFSRTEQLYGQIYSYFREHKISGLEDERSIAAKDLMPHQIKDLQIFIAKFFDAIDWSIYASDFEKLDITPVSQLRMLLAYYRRLRKLREYIVANKLGLQ